MSITAARLGSAPITLDWSHLGAVAPDAAAQAGIEAAWGALKARFASGEVGFYEAPREDAISQAEASRKLAAEMLGRGTLTDVLFLGIGGSALGPIAVLGALREKAAARPRFHFVENPDAVDWRLTLRHLDPASTLVVCATKSGTTFETMAQLLLALQWLGRERWKTHVVALTDPEKGDLRAFANAHGIPCLSIHPSLGGRFSVFSPVGLFPLALAGLDGAAFLQGAAQVREYCEKHAPAKNPLFLLGAEAIRQFKRRPIHVIMPYSTPLRSFGSWFVQLWAESLGKDGKGFTPLAALGATDQHSILQLLRDGPDDKITFFITVDRVSEPVAIPRTLPGVELAKIPAFAVLAGHSLHELLEIEYRAIAQVLARRSRPAVSWRLDAIDERSVGALAYAMCVMTAQTGVQWGVNPFDQPGVEEGKVYIRQALGDAASERMRRQIDEEQSPVGRLRLGRDSG